MAAELGTQHQDIVVSPADIAEVFPQVVWHTETPILRSAPAPLFLLSRLVRDNGYKVVVTGEGADEVLAGYDIFREARVRLFWSRDPESRKRDRAAELLYPWMARSPGQAPAFARSFFGPQPRPRRPGHLAPAAVGLDSAREGAAGPGDAGRGSSRGRGARTSSSCMPRGQRDVGSAERGRSGWR